MTKPLINYMTSFGDTHITIASNIIEDAKRLEKLFPGKTTAAYLDLFDSQQLDGLVKLHDLVISFVPPSFHMPILTACLRCKKDFVSSSYVSADMMKLDEELRKNDIVALNECGLDPGIDIMSTMKIVYEE